MVHLTVQLRCTLESQIRLFTCSLYLIQRRTNKIADIFKLGPVDKVPMRVRRRGRRRSGQKRNLLFK